MLENRKVNCKRHFIGLPNCCRLRSLRQALGRLRDGSSIVQVSHADCTNLSLSVMSGSAVVKAFRRSLRCSVSSRDTRDTQYTMPSGLEQNLFTALIFLEDTKTKAHSTNGSVKAVCKYARGQVLLYARCPEKGVLGRDVTSNNPRRILGSNEHRPRLHPTPTLAARIVKQLQCKEKIACQAQSLQGFEKQRKAYACHLFICSDELLLSPVTYSKMIIFRVSYELLMIFTMQFHSDSSKNLSSMMFNITITAFLYPRKCPFQWMHWPEASEV